MSDKPVNVFVENILLNDSLQGRVRLDPSIVEEYADSMKFDNVEFPAIDVYLDTDTDYMYLLDGFHRVEACKKIGKTSILANIVPIQTEDDAVWWAAAANQSHGLRRTNADNLRSLEMVLFLDSSHDLSDREIARRIGVSHTFVSIHRSKYQEQKPKEPNEFKSTDADASTETSSPKPDKETRVAAPKELKDRMRDVSIVYEALAKQISDCIESVEALATEPYGWSLNANTIKSDLGIALDSVIQGKPYKPCPYCQGDGCNACRNTGWVGRAVYDMAPDELK